MVVIADIAKSSFNRVVGLRAKGSQLKEEQVSEEVRMLFI
jgi:hypothetical protein